MSALAETGFRLIALPGKELIHRRFSAGHSGEQDGLNSGTLYRRRCTSAHATADQNVTAFQQT